MDASTLEKFEQEDRHSVNLVIDSKGKTQLAIQYVDSHYHDYLGRPVSLVLDMNTMDTPFGHRLVTTVYLIPQFTTEKVMYVGCTVHNPQDKHNIDSALYNALYNAGNNMLLNRLGRKPEQTFVHRKKLNMAPALRKWADHELRLAQHEGRNPKLAEEVEELGLRLAAHVGRYDGLLWADRDPEDKSTIQSFLETEEAQEALKMLDEVVKPAKSPQQELFETLFGNRS